ncbi:MAG: ferritin-like domain-containing protein [Actinobacteria bacterium]|nr:ferritin-like domain-containing protein [Actinomycetota bacterium]
MSSDHVEGQDLDTLWRRVIGRRSFLQGVGLAGAATLPGAVLPAVASAKSGGITKGDVAILRFLAAAEIIESDLWTQYAEFGGVAPGGGNAPYVAALQNLDGDMPQYISDNTDDELSHAAFLNAYLESKGAAPVSLEKFRTLEGSTATGSSGKRRLTNLLHLNVDTSWYTRYRSRENPDFGDKFAQAISIVDKPAIPVSDADTPPTTEVGQPPITGKAARRIQAIANTAGFHFAFIEQGGSSLYSTMALKATNLEVLRIVVSIGGVETNHFSLWHDKAGNAISDPLAPLTDPETGLMFRNFNSPATELTQTNLILPEPCDFIHESLPDCSVVRPAGITHNSGARAAVKGFTDDGLFHGQPPEFFKTLNKLADAADAARRHG